MYIYDKTKDFFIIYLLHFFFVWNHRRRYRNCMYEGSIHEYKIALQTQWQYDGVQYPISGSGCHQSRFCTHIELNIRMFYFQISFLYNIRDRGRTVYVKATVDVRGECMCDPVSVSGKNYKGIFYVLYKSFY